MRKFLINLTLVLTLVFTQGCSLIVKELLSDNEIQARDDGVDKIQVFTDLLNQGWQIKVINNKAILVKELEGGDILVNDVFNVSE